MSAAALDTAPPAIGLRGLIPRSTITHGGAPHLRLTRRGRAVFTVLAVFPLAIAALIVALNGGGATATADRSTGHFHYVTVEPGQSLWQLAESVAPNADPRDVIVEIVSLNQLGNSVIHPGEQLAIPEAYSR